MNNYTPYRLKEIFTRKCHNSCLEMAKYYVKIAQEERPEHKRSNSDIAMLRRFCIDLYREQRDKHTEEEHNKMFQEANMGAMFAFTKTNDRFYDIILFTCYLADKLKAL